MAAAPRPRRSLAALKRRAGRLEASGQAALAGWLGEPKVVAVVSHFRPDVQALLEPFGFHDKADVISAAGVLTGMTGRTPEGEEWPNPFVDWSAERLAHGGLIARMLRGTLALTTERLRIEGVLRLQAVEDNPRYVDRRGFAGDHLALLLLLWLDIPLEGRTGAEIASDLPAMPTVGWYRDDGDMSITDHADERDVRDAFALRRAWQVEQGRPPIPRPYARGGTRAKPRAEPARDARRKAVATVVARFPEVTAGQLRASWGEDASTPGGLLRTRLKRQPHDPAPSESTLRLDLRSLNR